MRKAIVVLGSMFALTGCATGYHASGITGGLTQTKLSDRIYQVRFQGNGYTSQERTSVFLLRRCAELTLESAFRYFTLGPQGTGSMSSGTTGFIFSFPHGNATVKFLEKSDEDPNPLDAVAVVNDTDKLAGGRLSEKARWQLRVFEGNAAPLVPGTRLYAPDGRLYGEVIQSVKDHPFPNGPVSDAVSVKQADGTMVWIGLEHAMKLIAKPAPAAKE